MRISDWSSDVCSSDLLASLGTIEIPRDDYLARLASALGEVAALGVADGVGVGAGTATGAAVSPAASSFASADFFALDAAVPSDPTATVSGPVSGRDLLPLLVPTS